MSGWGRGIRFKALVAITTTLVFGGLLEVLSLRGFLLASFLRSETAAMEGELGHVARHVAFLLEDLSEYTAEYAAWDDTWEFVSGNYPTYFNENFTFPPSAYKTLALVAVVDRGGRLVAGTTFDAASATYGTVPGEFLDTLRRHPELVAHRTPKSQFTGLVSIGGRPLLLASRPIVRNNFEGPIRGTLLIGQKLDNELLRRLGSTGIGPAHVYTIADPHLPPEAREAAAALRGGEKTFVARPSGELLVGYVALQDLAGAPAFALRVALERSGYASGVLSLKIMLVVLVGIVGLSGAIYVLLLERTVLRRVIRLGVVVERIGAGSATADELAADGTDEIGVLAAKVRETFRSEALLKAELQEAKQVLELRVAERTKDLRDTVDALEQEVAVRRRAEEQVRELESHQRAVFENMDSGLVTFDEGLRVLSVNAAALKVLRLTPSCVGRPLAKVLPAVLAAAVEQEFRAARPAEGRREIGVTLGESRALILGYQLSEVPSGEGRGRQGILLFDDRTAEIRLAQEQQRLSRLATLGEFSAQVAHELRNPLTAMSSTVQYLQQESGGRERELFGILSESMGRMELIIRRMQLLSREMPLARTRVDLAELLRTLLAFVDASLKKQHIGVRFRAPARRCAVVGDPAQLHQAFLNLVMNAVQAMPDGGRLRVRLARGRRRPDVPAPALVLIADSGAGIPPEVAGRILDPFYTTRESGSGLGLPIADRIVRDHGGSLRFASRPRGGWTCFAVILPGLPEEEGA